MGLEDKTGDSAGAINVIFVLRDFLRYPHWFHSQEESFKILSQRVNYTSFFLPCRYRKNLRIFDKDNFSAVYVNFEKWNNSSGIIITAGIENLVKILVPGGKHFAFKIKEGFIPVVQAYFSYDSDADIREVLDVFRKDYVFLCNKEGEVNIARTSGNNGKTGEEVLKKIYSSENLSELMKRRVSISSSGFLF